MILVGLFPFRIFCGIKSAPQGCLFLQGHSPRGWQCQFATLQCPCPTAASLNLSYKLQAQNKISLFTLHVQVLHNKRHKSEGSEQEEEEKKKICQVFIILETG